jgi:hypothetical protein
MNTIPSPIPPWKRAGTSPLSNTIFTDGTIALTYDTTYLNSTAIRMVGSPPVVSPYVVVLPPGSYVRQIIRIYIVGQNISPFTTAQFSVTGQFAGFTSLTLGNNATSSGAVLEWDGVLWHLIGGAATVVP